MNQVYQVKTKTEIAVIHFYQAMSTTLCKGQYLLAIFVSSLCCVSPIFGVWATSIWSFLCFTGWYRYRRPVKYLYPPTLDYVMFEDVLSL